ncbi:hypothetical protein Bca52824_050666 [Brassica carinata]|uniref:Oleosin n=2 Tax=Brassica TaxID=3705 RepID=A0A8X7R0E8_BRACI|nr:hypothetical protein Bca52824_050666 [Brassica carinata]
MHVYRARYRLHNSFIKSPSLAITKQQPSNQKHMREEEHQNELVQTPSQRAENCFRCNVFAFLVPLLEVIKVVAAPVASVIFIGFAGIILACLAVALAVSAPLFIIFSPVLVPAATIATTLGTGVAFAVTAVALIIWLTK